MFHCQSAFRVVCLILMVACFSTPAVQAAPPAWAPEIHEYLQAHLSLAEQQALVEFFADGKPLPGPIMDDQTVVSGATLERYRAQVRHRFESGRRQRVTPQQVEAQVQGSGTKDDPWQGLIGQAIEQYGSSVDILIIPEGYYEEYGLDLPAGLSLRGEGEAVIVPPVDLSRTAQDMVILSRGSSGVADLIFDGSRADYDPQIYVQEPRRRLLNAIRIEGGGHRVAINNVIRHIPGVGVIGRRDGGGSHLVMDNDISYTDIAGIQSTSGWMIFNNRVRYSGRLRGGPGALGGDAIIVGSRGGENVVLHNLVIAQRKPNARHGIATQNVVDNIIESNVVISVGELRGGIRFSDKSDKNTVRRNLVLAIPDETGNMVSAIRVNGSRSNVSGNAIYFAERGIATLGWPANSFNIIHNNRIAVDVSPIAPSLYDDIQGNTLLSSHEVKPED